jgi:hypothetical protein
VKWLDGLWRDSDRFALLFVLLIGDYILLTLVNSIQWGGLLRGVPVSVTVLYALHTSRSRPMLVKVAWVVVAFLLVVGIVQAATKAPVLRSVDLFIVTVMLAMAAVAILRRILGQSRVEVESLFGALYVGMAQFQAEHHLQPFLAQPGRHTSSDYFYLSFETLTTVGFGDLTPLTNGARSVVVLEAIVGQIFLVTLVARLVSLFAANEGLKASAPEAPPSPTPSPAEVPAAAGGVPPAAPSPPA